MRTCKKPTCLWSGRPPGGTPLNACRPGEHPIKTNNKLIRQSRYREISIMAPSRRSNRASKSKKHYELTPYLPRRSREPIQSTVLPEKVFQSVLAKVSPISNFITHIEYPNFEPIVVTEHDFYDYGALFKIA
jgi:hypothetical protein